MIELRNLVLFWGKSAPADAWHPAIAHMIDVGQVTACFLDCVASPATMRFLAAPFGGDEAFVRRFLPLQAALHDVGRLG